MDVKKIRKVCRPIRIVLGLGLIAYGVYSGNNWFYLSAIPLVAGIMNICPLCKITGQCELMPKSQS